MRSSDLSNNLLDSFIKAASTQPKKTDSEKFAEKILSVLHKPEQSLQDIALAALRQAKANKLAQQLMDDPAGIDGIDPADVSNPAEAPPEDITPDAGLDSPDADIAPEPDAGLDSGLDSGGDISSLIEQAISLLNKAKGMGSPESNLAPEDDLAPEGDIGGDLGSDLDVAPEDGIGSDVDIQGDGELDQIANEVGDLGKDPNIL